jgi:hypothetical protein
MQHDARAKRSRGLVKNEFFGAAQISAYGDDALTSAQSNRIIARAVSEPCHGTTQEGG